jgi:restriction system protein
MTVTRAGWWQPLDRLDMAPASGSRGRRERVPAAGDAYRWGVSIIALLTVGFLLWVAYHRLVKPAWLLHLPRLFSRNIILLETAAALTLAALWIGLAWHQWQRHLPLETHNELAGVARLQRLSPRAFERYVADIFRRKGFYVLVRGRSGDLGVDLDVTGPDGQRAIVQCKRYHNTVGAEIVRELYGTLVHENVAHAFLVTTADISDAAREWAEGKPITLIDGNTLVEIAINLGQRKSNDG